MTTVQINGPISGDNAPMINNAINTVANNGGGIVAVAAGRYTLYSQVNVLPHVHIIGEDNGFDAGGSLTQPIQGSGTIFDIYWGNGSGASNDRTAAAFTLAKSSIENCGFNYPYQNSAMAIPYEYGPTILAIDGGASAIKNFTSNAYTFLDFRGSVANVALYNVTAEENWGSPLAYGLRIDNIGDWSRFGRNIFHVGWFDFGDTEKDHISWWSETNGCAFEVGNTDWVNLEDEQVVGYLYGCRLVFNDVGLFAGHRGPIHLSRVKFDGCFYACIAAIGGGEISNLRVSDSTFTAFDIYDQTQTSQSGGMILLIDGHTKVVQLQFIGNHVFGSTNYVLFTTPAQVQDLVALGNVGWSDSPIAAQNAVFTIGQSNNVTLRDNIFHGWGSVYSGNANNFSNSFNTH